MQSLKKFVMLAMVALFGALAVAPAHAQSSLTVNVPFDFVLGKTTFKSGSYRVARNGTSFAAFVDADRHAKYAMLLPGDDAPVRNGQPYLVFTRYGQESFLDKVVFSSDEVYDLPVSNREKEMKAQLTSGNEMAVLILPLR